MPQDQDALTRALIFYARISAGLFPILTGSKDPDKLIQGFKWKFDFSRDPMQWQAWRDQFPGCNFGVYASGSRLIIIDIDVVKYGAQVAWQAWCELCASWGLSGPIYPHVMSARGGWHVYLIVPTDLDPYLFRQPALIKDIIDIRTNGYTVSAGSYYDGTTKGEASGPYELLSDRDPEPAPQALLDLVKRTNPKDAKGAVVKPTKLYQAADVRKLLIWLRDDHGGFEDYKQWIDIGMILRLEFGDDIGLDMWREATWQPPHPKAPTEDEILKHWQSFTTAPAPGVQTIRSLFLKAHQKGWKGGTIHLSWDAAAEHFARTGTRPPDAYVDATGQTVAAIAHNAGATLVGQPPAPMQNVPLPAGFQQDAVEAITAAQRGAAQAEVIQPTIDAFLSATDLPHTPMMRDFPRIPDQAEHPSVPQMRFVIERLVACGEDRKTWRANRLYDVLGALMLVHEQTHTQVFSLLAVTLGLPGLIGDGERKIIGKMRAFYRAAESKIRPVKDFQCDAKGRIDINISENAAIFLEQIGVNIRFNNWLETIELQGGRWWPEWTKITDAIITTLWAEANKRDVGYHIGVDSLWRHLQTLARENTVDPAVDLLKDLESTWDGERRLSVWLSATAGVSCDLYHQAVGRMIFGNMVRRIREPGCKCDYVPVFWGPEDTGKSTLARRIAPQPEWFSDTIQLGTESKELVLALAGVAVVELAEMATKSGREAEHIKAMISTQIDRGRTAYEKVVKDRPRRCVFIGTSNPPPLIDTNGNRRYLPIHVVSAINHEWFKANREQLIAEACVLHSRGESFNLPIDVRSHAEAQREDARIVTAVENELTHWLAETDITRSVRWSYITGRDLDQLLEFNRVRYSNNQRPAIMGALGFRKMRLNVDSKQTQCWVRGVDAHGPWIVKEGLRYVVGKMPDGSAVVRPTLPGR